MPYANPYPTVISSDSSYDFSAMANAAYFQRVTITLGGQVAAVFNGQGEGVPMTIAGGGTSYGGATRQAVSVLLLFEFSQDGTNYSPATVAEVLSMPGILMIGTEDANDGDNNDTVLKMSSSPV